jgi:hypothetical protein
MEIYRGDIIRGTYQISNILLRNYHGEQVHFYDVANIIKDTEDFDTFLRRNSTGDDLKFFVVNQHHGSNYYYHNYRRILFDELDRVRGILIYYINEIKSFIVYTLNGKEIDDSCIIWISLFLYSGGISKESIFVHTDDNYTTRQHGKSFSVFDRVKNEYKSIYGTEIPNWESIVTLTGVRGSAIKSRLSENEKEELKARNIRKFYPQAPPPPPQASPPQAPSPQAPSPQDDSIMDASKFKYLKYKNKYLNLKKILGK